MKVLLVEGDEAVRRLVHLVLTNAGNVVEAVSDPRAALGRACEWQPDLILLDVVMPEPGGPAVQQVLKLHPFTRSIPVVYLTGRADRDSAALLASGAVSVIGKPFDPDRLATQVEAIGRLVGRRGA